MRSFFKSKKRIALMSAALLLLAGSVTVTVLLLMRDRATATPVPTVTVESPGRMSASDRDAFSLGLVLNTLGDDHTLYPAASFSITFDPARLEFLGPDEGNIRILSPDSPSGTAMPAWRVNVAQSNQTGIIHVLYLDMTGGRYAFSPELSDGEQVLFLLKFRLRDGVRAGDVLTLTVDDAVFAASDESRSLASVTGTLQTVDGRIMIGE